MGNRTPSITVESLKQLKSRAVNHFESWAYWLRLTHLPCFKRAAELDEQVFHTVLVFLQMGNFTAVDGSVRRYVHRCVVYSPFGLPSSGHLVESRATARGRMNASMSLACSIMWADFDCT